MEASKEKDESIRRLNDKCAELRGIGAKCEKVAETQVKIMGEIRGLLQRLDEKQQELDYSTELCNRLQHFAKSSSDHTRRAADLEGKAVRMRDENEKLEQESTENRELHGKSKGLEKPLEGENGEQLLGENADIEDRKAEIEKLRKDIRKLEEKQKRQDDKAKTVSNTLRETRTELQRAHLRINELKNGKFFSNEDGTFADPGEAEALRAWYRDHSLGVCVAELFFKHKVALRGLRNKVQELSMARAGNPLDLVSTDRRYCHRGDQADAWTSDHLSPRSASYAACRKGLKAPV